MHPDSIRLDRERSYWDDDYCDKFVIHRLDKIKGTADRNKAKEEIKRILREKNATVNIVHEAWDLFDPTPSIFELFARFNTRFFNNEIQGYKLEWSDALKTIAGRCCHPKGGESGIILLSEPLLQWRNRRDLIDVLLVW